MKKKKSFAIYTLGCKLNFSESSEISRQLFNQGFEQNETPDYIIVNSCAVTATAEKKSRNLISKLYRQYPNAEIVVIGCYSELSASEIQKWDGITAVFGSGDKMNIIPHLIGGNIQNLQKNSFFSSFSVNDRTRSFLKIQDGCDYHCTYCTVATARGDSRSDTIEHVLKQMEEIDKQGVKEVILTGVNLGDFGQKNGTSFFKLLQEIEKQAIIPRIRISSIEPNLLTDEIIEFVAHSQRIMPHFHIPLQAGSNRILSLMQRRYNVAFFANKIYKIKELIPDACIAVDIIAGFPSETEEDFKNSYQFVEQLPLSYLHVFTYSKRPNTPAAAMPNHIPSVQKKERTTQLLALSKRKKEQFYHEFIGQFRPVLVESNDKKGFLYGFTDNYIKVKFPYEASFINTIIKKELTINNLVIDEHNNDNL